MKVLRFVGVRVLLAVAGVLVGLMIGLMFVSRYMSVRVSGCGLEPASACELLDFLGESNLTAVDNYGEQKTAPVHVLEPKVSDAYLQYGSGDIKTYNPQGSR